VFNALTGLRARVGNYAGVTVERKEGRFQSSPPDLPLTVLDLPGTYSLSPQSLDEQIARDVLFHRLPDVPAPAVVVVVVDASNLERNLYFATQVIELGYPTIIALNMVDVAEKIGQKIDADQLAAELGTPVAPMVASTGEGIRNCNKKSSKSSAPRRPGPRPDVLRFARRLPGRGRRDGGAAGAARRPAAGLAASRGAAGFERRKIPGRRAGAICGGHPPGGRRRAAAAGRRRH
jgi:Fe2+ transport system protein B